MTTGNSAMQLKTGSGWQRGLDNVLRGELRRWFGTRTWWVQIIIWALSINLIFLMVGLSAPRDELPAMDAVVIFNVFLGVVGPIGVSIIMQGAVVGEKRSGTAAWVLSKPVSRIAFILSKLVGNTLGVTVTMVLAQGLIAYLIAALVLNTMLPVGGFLAALGVHLIHILFYLTLTLMMGTIFDSIAPVIGIPLAFLFSQNILPSFFGPLMKFMPWTLALPLNNSQDLPVTAALMTGEPVVSYLPLYGTLTASVLFVIIALWIFQRQEL